MSSEDRPRNGRTGCQKEQRDGERIKETDSQAEREGWLGEEREREKSEREEGWTKRILAMTYTTVNDISC